jgi:branched-chain amino acid transport system ATP-binding protein
VIPPALELIGVHAGYGQIEVLRGVDLVVPAASVVVLLGANGAGKTTTMKVIDGRHRQSSGCVHVAGQHLANPSSGKLARAGVCSIPEGRGIFPNLTVEENLRLVTYARDKTAVADVEERAFERFPALAARRSQLAGTMSGGEQQMLAMARAVVTDPSLLLVDEPSMGLSPLVVGHVYEVLGQLAADGMAVLLVEQFARTALAVADYAAVMAHGSIRAFGQPADLDAVAQDYLGGAA